jgi:hypothetical protein
MPQNSCPKHSEPHEHKQLSSGEVMCVGNYLYGPVVGQRLDALDTELKYTQVRFIKELDPAELRQFNQDIALSYGKLSGPRS